MIEELVWTVYCCGVARRRYSEVHDIMRRLSMRNKHRKSETVSDSDSEENGGNVDNDKNETQKAAAGRSNHNVVSDIVADTTMRKSAVKRRSRGSVQQKQSTAHADDGDEVKDESSTAEEPKERENGEKTAMKPSPNKRKKKEDQKASTSTREQSGEDNEYEV